MSVMKTLNTEASTIQGPWLPMFMETEIGKDAFEYGATTSRKNLSSHQ